MNEIVNYKTLKELWYERGYKISNGINLIVAPCGSGKTYFTFNTLIKEEKLENVIYLCDTRNLKNAVALDKDYSNLCRFYFENEDNNVVNNSIVFGEGFGENKITVMTYAQFGLLAEKYPNSFSKVKLIICDEAHQAIDYHRKFDKDDKKTYRVAIQTINSLSEQAKVILLSATPEIIKLNRLKKENIFDFRNEPNIKRLKENMIIPYSTNKDIKNIIEEFKTLTLENKVKMLVYTDRITTVKFIVNTCYEVGLKAVGLWSLNNKKNAMNTYQLKCLDSVVKDSLIPEEVDILVINASLQTGINIKNKDIEWVLVNSTNKTTQIQARSRARKDIDRLYLKSNDVLHNKKIYLDEKWLNRPLTSKDKQELCNELELYDERGRLKKWKAISKELIKNRYKIKNSRLSDAKRTSVSTISS